MIRICLAAALSACVMVAYTTPADACGVKLTVKAPRVKKKVKKSDNPSRILLVGNPPRKLSRRLSQAGHKVDVAESSSDARRKNYALVVADPDKFDKAKEDFPNSRVIKRSSSTRSNLKQVEQKLAEKAPVRRDRVATRKKRVKPKFKPKKKPTRTQPPKRVEEKIEKPDPPEDVDTDTDDSLVQPRDPDPPEDTGAEPVWTEELAFGLNRSGIGRQNRKLLRDNIRWLKQNPDVTVTLEGHTDSSGRDEYNKYLGLKRAKAVRSYLVRRGIKRSRIEVVSFGEERPAYDEDDRNRRVVFVKN